MAFDVRAYCWAVPFLSSYGSKDGGGVSSMLSAAGDAWFIDEIINNEYVHYLLAGVSVAIPAGATILTEMYGVNTVLAYTALTAAPIAVIGLAGLWIYNNDTAREWVSKKYEDLKWLFFAKKVVDASGPIIKNVKEATKDMGKDLVKGVVEGAKNTIAKTTGVNPDSDKSLTEQIAAKGTEKAVDMTLEGVKVAASAAGGAMATLGKAGLGMAMANPVAAIAITGTVAVVTAYHTSTAFKEAVDENVIEPLKEAHKQAGEVVGKTVEAVMEADAAVSDAIEKAATITLDSLETMRQMTGDTEGVIAARAAAGISPPSVLIAVPFAIARAMLASEVPSPPPLADQPKDLVATPEASTSLTIQKHEDDLYLPEIIGLPLAEQVKEREGKSNDGGWFGWLPV